MVKTAPQMYDFFREQGTALLAHVDTAAAQRNYAWAATNLGESLRSYLMAGLIAWRRELTSPRDSLTSVVRIAQRAATELPGLAPSPDVIWREVDFPSAALIELLTDGRVSADVAGFLPPGVENVTRDDVAGDATWILDGALVRELMGESKALQQTLDIVPMAKRLALLRTTYETYLRILRACANGAPVDDEVRHADELFVRRQRDSYYAGGIGTDGGGPDNDYTVDYRLGAILKTCSASGVATPHAWRF